MEFNPIQNVAERNQVIKTEEEVEKTLKFSIRNKVQGPGGIPIIYSNMEEKIKKTFLVDIFNEIFVGENMPQEYNSAYIFLMYKKGLKRIVTITQEGLQLL